MVQHSTVTYTTPQADPDGIYLVFYHPGGTDRFRLGTGESAILGRSHPSDWVIDEETLSRKHARFSWDGKRLHIEDVGSTNGTRISGGSGGNAIAPGDDIVISLGSVRAIVQLQENATHRREDGGVADDLLVQGEAMESVLRQLRRVGPADIAVLLHGETGTGKELAANVLHHCSGRRSGPFIAVNCGAMPPTLLESTLFGHEQGAFTGARFSSAGVFEAAHGGTLFLDEVGELSAEAQSALLRVLETKKLARLGSRREREVDVRIVTATHRDLEAMTANGLFRQDLLFRLNAVSVTIPALRYRVDEIEPLAHHFLDLANRKFARSVRLGGDVIALLKSYSWPGNVRELRNEIERAVVMTESSEVRPADFSSRLRSSRETVVPPVRVPSTSAALIGTFPPAAPSLANQAAINFRDIMMEHERSVLLEAYRRANGNQSEAARLLQMKPRTFNHKFRTLGLGEG